VDCKNTILYQTRNYYQHHFVDMVFLLIISSLYMDMLFKTLLMPISHDGKKRFSGVVVAQNEAVNGEDR